MLEDLLSHVEFQKAKKGVNPAWESPIEWGVTPVAAKEIAILGVSELKRRHAGDQNLISEGGRHTSQREL